MNIAITLNKLNKLNQQLKKRFQMSLSKKLVKHWRSHAKSLNKSQLTVIMIDSNVITKHVYQ